MKFDIQRISLPDQHISFIDKLTFRISKEFYLRSKIIRVLTFITGLKKTQ